MIGKSLGQDEFIEYYDPGYPDLLGAQLSVLLRDIVSVVNYRRETRDCYLTYIMGTHIHPRKSRQGHEVLQEVYFKEWVLRSGCSNSYVDNITVIFL